MNFVDDYVDAHKMQRREATDVMEEFSYDLLNMRGRCIDIGSGPGDVTKELLLPLLPPDAEVVGADISQRMTDYANLQYADDTRLSFIVMDIEAPELPSNEIGRYDHAVSFFCLHWCKDMRRALENIYKLLRTEGTALIEFLGYHNGFESYNVLKNVPRYEPYMQDASRYVPYFQRSNETKDSRARLRQILEETGFNILHCSKREKYYIYENRDIFRKHVAAVNPFVSRMPDEMKDSFIDDTVKEIMCHELLIRCKEQEQRTTETQQEQREQQDMILDRYRVLLAYVKKP